MNIYLIKTINGGFKGLELSFLEERTEANKRKFIDDITKEKNDPIHLALDKLIKSLRKYLLEICGNINDRMDDSEIDYAIAETEIISIEMKKTFFIIKGEREWKNNKRYTLKTPKIEEKDNHDSFEDVRAILMDIRKEAEIYLKGTAIVTDQEAAVRWITSGKDKSMTKDDYDKMTEEEQLAYHKKIIEEKFGGIVMVQEDVTEDIEHEEVLLLEENIQEIDLEEM